MLRKFEVTNFKNFREPLCVDFTKVHDYQYNEYCIRNNLINKMIIYGKNAVGKSNLGMALFDIANDILYTRNPYVYRGDRYLYKNANADDSELVEFFYSFQFGSTVIDYLYKKKDVSEVVYEKLIINNEIIFFYDLINNQSDFSNVSLINANDLNWAEFLDSTQNLDNKDIESTQPTALRYIIYNTVQTEQTAIYKLSNFIKGMRFAASSSTGFPFRMNISEYLEDEEDLFLICFCKEFVYVLHDNADQYLD